jgi:hypothetical protein
MIAAHIHNVRCMWIKMMGARHGIAIPWTVDPRRVRASELLRALPRSSDGIIRLLQLGIAQGGVVPRAAWQNFPTDLVHFLNYFVAHEAHHRGQLCMLARQMGQRLPGRVTAGPLAMVEASSRVKLTAKKREPRRSIQGAYIRREAQSGFERSARMRSDTLARIGPLARYLLAV